MTQLPPQTYSWKVTDSLMIAQIKNAKKGSDTFASPIFTMHGFSWYLKFRKHDGAGFSGNAVLFLYIAEIPPKVSVISAGYEFSIKEFNIKYVNTGQFTKGHISKGWSKNTLLTKDVKNFYQLTMQCKITLINVYDKDGNAITDEYRNKNNIQSSSQSDDRFQIYEARLNSLTNQMDIIMKNMNKMQKTIEDLVLKGNEEQKNNDNDLHKRMDDLTKTVQILMNNNNNNVLNQDKQELKEWVHNKLKLPQYYDVFIDNGFECLDDIILLDMNQLNQIGIDKIGHKMRILHQIIELKQKPNDNIQEGNLLHDTNK